MKVLHRIHNFLLESAEPPKEISVILSNSTPHVLTA
jgi:hypothetical protein